MGLHKKQGKGVPENTAKMAKGAFRKGNPYISLRDRLDAIYTDEDFGELYPSHCGRPAYSPGNLALCLIVQFAEGLSDRQMADAVRGRMDLKYLLGLELDDPGFDHTVLHSFRERLLEQGQEEALLNRFLAIAQENELVKSGGKQRTDATHVLGAVRNLNRLECVGETMRNALEALAIVAPEWLQQHSPGEWFLRYAKRFEQYRLPKGKAKRQELAEQIGQDGQWLLQACAADNAPKAVREIEAVHVLRVVWEQQYIKEGEKLRWRATGECVPAAEAIESPYDTEVHYSRMKSKDSNWVGYKVHLTETCDDELPHLITNVETRPSTEPDVEATAEIQAHLIEKGLKPEEHLVDSGYVDAELLTESQDEDINLIGPVQTDTSWQAREGKGYDLSHFTIDWENKSAICPQQHQSTIWSTSAYQGHDVIHVHFSRDVCAACTARELCTQAKRTGRTLKLRTKAEHEARQKRLETQETAEFRLAYQRRAGVEGTVSQGVRNNGLRRSRYIGIQKTHLGHVLTALAVNIQRLHAWWEGKPPATTRSSHFGALATVAF